MAEPERNVLNFVKSLLRIANPTPNFVERVLVQPDVAKRFENAFTHKSFDPENNYDLYRIKGEVVVNEFVAFYIFERFPRMRVLKFITRCKHNIFNRRQLASIFLKCGLGDYLRVGEEMASKITTLKPESQEHLTPLEGAAMGFFGCLGDVMVNDLDLARGTFIDFAFRILRGLFDAEVVATDFETIFDPITRYKELTTNPRIVEWPTKFLYEITKTKFEIPPSDRKIKEALEKGDPAPTVSYSEIVHVKAYGWPLNDRKFYPSDPTRNRVTLAEVTESSETEAKFLAASKALEVLKTYGIRETPQNPYYTPQPYFADPIVQPPPDSSLRIFVKELLEKSGISQPHIDVILTPKTISILKLAFTDSSVDSINNLELPETKGDVIINRFVVDYLFVRFADVIPTIKRVDLVGYLTKIKHIFISKQQFASFAVKFGFDRFARYARSLKRDISNAEYQSFMEDIFEAFFGCLCDAIVLSGFSHGAATDVIGNILKGMFDTQEISLDAKSIVDSVTRLKELSESKVIGLGWNFKAMTRIYKEGDQVRAIFYGWPGGDRSMENEKNRRKLGEAIAPSEKEAKAKAAEQALELLDKKYNLRPVSKFV